MGICWSEPPIQPVATSQAVPTVQTVQTVQTQSPMYSTVNYSQYGYTTPQSYLYNNQAIQITVKTLTGRVIPLTIYLSDTIYQVKQRIQFIMGIPPERQVLIYMGKQLEDNKYVFYYQILNGICVNLVLRM